MSNANDSPPQAKIRPPPTDRHCAPRKFFHYQKNLTKMIMTKKMIRQRFDEALTNLADLQAHYMALEKRPKWHFWLLFKSKRQELAEARFWIEVVKDNIESLRLLFYTSHESNHATHQAKAEN